MYGFLSILAVPAIIAIASGSVILISKAGGKKATKKIQELNGVFTDDSNKNK